MSLTTQNIASFCSVGEQIMSLARRYVAVKYKIEHDDVNISNITSEGMITIESNWYDYRFSEEHFSDDTIDCALFLNPNWEDVVTKQLEEEEQQKAQAYYIYKKGLAEEQEEQELQEYQRLRKKYESIV